jgi:hypothetical protein
MNNTVESIVAKMQELQNNQDGTLKGGFISVTAGRYRIIVGKDNSLPMLETASNGSKGDLTTICANRNVACTNQICVDTTNTINPEPGQHTCTNNGTCFAQ